MFSVRRLLFTSSLCISFLFSRAQTADWWNQNVNWDGRTHWSKYIIISPKYMGPNALTIPLINNGSIDSFSSLGVSGHFHFSDGDNTQNLVLYGNYVSKDKTISIDAQFVPYEQFQMSHEIKTERKTFYLDYYKKHVTGDVTANTTIQLFNRSRDKFQFALRLGVRMPSGGGLTLARYGDVPGYWIDGGFGLPIKNSHWKWIGMAGFYVWQINLDNHRQDDAFVFGTGFEFNNQGWRWQAYTTGYSGWQNNGDRPTLVRLHIEKRAKRKFYLLRLQQGLHDYAYFSIETGVKVVLGQ
jgi:hypothetical protein